MPTHPRARREGTADEAAALAFVTAGADGLTHHDDTAHDREAAGDHAAARDLDAAREQRIRRMLDFEAGWSSHGGAKARAIRAEFGWSTTRYYQVLDGLLETREAVRHDPMLVRRLLRLREGR